MGRRKNSDGPASCDRRARNPETRARDARLREDIAAAVRTYVAPIRSHANTTKMARIIGDVIGLPPPAARTVTLAVSAYLAAELVQSGSVAVPGFGRVMARLTRKAAAIGYNVENPKKADAAMRGPPPEAVAFRFSAFGDLSERLRDSGKLTPPG